MEHEDGLLLGRDDFQRKALQPDHLRGEVTASHHDLHIRLGVLSQLVFGLVTVFIGQKAQNKKIIFKQCVCLSVLFVTSSELHKNSFSISQVQEHGHVLCACVRSFTVLHARLQRFWD